MREILFRGLWVHGNKEWIEGDLVRDKDGKPHIVDNNYVDYWHDDQTFVCEEECEVLPETVGQYTGLTDKNGKKIFEGDILKAITFDKNLEQIAVIGFGNFVDENNDDEYLGFYIEFDGIKTTIAQLLLEEVKYRFEVVGNIHDNKELLEVK